MNDTDREAFETHYDNKYTPGYAYPSSHRVHAWEDWQAAHTQGWNETMDYAREVNAPMLTERAAVDTAWKAFSASLGHGIAFQEYQAVRKALACALKAAGIRFKEEA
jgi:hypothetical protein